MVSIEVNAPRKRVPVLVVLGAIRTERGTR